MKVNRKYYQYTRVQIYTLPLLVSWISWTILLHIKRLPFTVKIRATKYSNVLKNNFIGTYVLKWEQRTKANNDLLLSTKEHLTTTKPWF